MGQTTATYQTFAQDQFAAARIDNAPLDPKYPGFFRLPGTSTFLKIGGYFKTDLLYDGKPAGDAERFIPSSIPSGLPVVNNTTVSIRPTRLNLDFRVPVKALGVSASMWRAISGSNYNADAARVRRSKLLTGRRSPISQIPIPDRTHWTFRAPASGHPQPADPLQRETREKDQPGSRLKPSSDVAFKTPEFSALPNSPSPDGVVTLRQEYEGGHVQISGLFRDIAAYLPNGAGDGVFGWGVNFTGAQKVYGKDTFVYQAAYGPGIQRYLNDTSGLGIDAAVVAMTKGACGLCPTAPASYQHWWVAKVLERGLWFCAGQPLPRRLDIPAATTSPAT